MASNGQTLSTLRRFRAVCSFLLRLGLKRGEARNSKKRTQLSTASKLSPLSPSSRLGTDWLRHQQTHANVKCGSFRKMPMNMLLTSHRRAESRAAQVRLATLFAFHGAVQIIARSSPTHGLERRLVRFFRLQCATLLIFV